jgi:microcystin-dependent protein
MPNAKISALPPATSVLTTDEFPINQGGTTKKVTLEQIQNSVSVTVGFPTGGIMMFAVSGVPTGWLECDGSVLAINNYTNLYNVIGQNYKTLNTFNTLSGFQIPDLRGEFVRGWDHGRNVDTGRILGSWQKGTIFGHDNTATTNGVVGVVYTGGNVAQNITLSAVGLDNYNILDYPNIELGSVPSTNDTILPNWSNLAGGSGITRPRNVSLVYCIKV